MLFVQSVGKAVKNFGAARQPVVQPVEHVAVATSSHLYPPQYKPHIKLNPPNSCNAISVKHTTPQQSIDFVVGQSSTRTFVIRHSADRLSGTTTGAFMARSLSKIKEQIAKLQKEADSIQSSVIARIRKEIALHDLTAEHLFGGATAIASANAKPPRGVSPITPTAKKKATGKPAKYADDTGNTWGGLGKRPQWIREALDAGRTLEEFLVSPAKPAAKPKAKGARPPKAAATPARKKVAAGKKPAKASAPAPKMKVPAGKLRKPAASVKKAPAKKAAARKTRAAKSPASAPEAGDQAVS